MRAKLREYCDGDDRSKYRIKQSKTAGEMIHGLHVTFAGENSNHVYGTNLFSALKFTLGDVDISNRAQMTNSISLFLNHCSSLPDIQMSLREVTALLFAGTLKNNRSDAVLARKMTDILK